MIYAVRVYLAASVQSLNKIYTFDTPTQPIRELTFQFSLNGMQQHQFQRAKARCSFSKQGDN